MEEKFLNPLPQDFVAETHKIWHFIMFTKNLAKNVCPRLSHGWSVGCAWMARPSFSLPMSVVFPALAKPRNITVFFFLRKNGTENKEILCPSFMSFKGVFIIYQRGGVQAEINFRCYSLQYFTNTSFLALLRGIPRVAVMFPGAWPFCRLTLWPSVCVLNWNSSYSFWARTFIS